ncbi:MAG: hypothetical protein HYY43_05775 [Deltaproteobacteria bacterium]|nr:hypothetical protein [Deltaproteobacteria bacterium]
MKKAKKKAKRTKRKSKVWTMNDFVDSVWSVMEEQARENKALRALHAKLSPEWNNVIQKVTSLLEAKDDKEITERTEEICNYGKDAVRPLIETILRLKSAVLAFQEKKE